MTFISSHKGNDQSQGYQFSTYAWRAMINNCNNYLIKDKRQDSYVIRQEESSYVPDYLGDIIDRETLLKIKRVMRKFPLFHRRVLRLRYQGMTLSAIGKEIGYTREGVGYILRKCFAEIKSRCL